MLNIKCEGLKLDYTNDVKRRIEYPNNFNLYTVQILDYNQNQDMKSKLNFKNKLDIMNFTHSETVQLDDLFAMFRELGMKAKIWKNMSEKCSV